MLTRTAVERVVQSMFPGARMRLLDVHPAQFISDGTGTAVATISCSLQDGGDFRVATFEHRVRHTTQIDSTGVVRLLPWPEFFFYNAGLALSLPPGVRAPRCYGTFGQGQGTAGLQLEVPALSVLAWSPEACVLSPGDWAQ